MTAPQPDRRRISDRRAIRDRRYESASWSVERRLLGDRRRTPDRRSVDEPVAEHLRNALQFLGHLSLSERLDHEDRADLDALRRRLTLALQRLERRASPPKGFPPLP